MPATVNRTIRIGSFCEASETKLSTQIEFNEQYNNFYRLVYVSDGKALWSDFADEYILEAGDVLLLRMRTGQKIENYECAYCKLIIICTDLSGYDIQKILGRKIRINSLSVQKLNAVAEKIRQGNIFDNNKYFLHELANLTEIFMISLIETSDETHIISSRAANEFKQIVEVMRNNVDKPLNVKEIASKCGMSESNLKKIFAKYSVCSVHKYFLKMKVFKAIELLDNNYNVSEITEMLSFNNQNYFGVVFKKETGYSPLNYRKKFLRSL